MKKIFMGDHALLMKKMSEKWPEKIQHAVRWTPSKITDASLQELEDLMTKLPKAASVLLEYPGRINPESSFFTLYKMIDAAGGIVENEKGKLLMQFRRGKWDLPKGKLDKGEGLRTAAKREITEETGVRKLTVTRKIKLLNGKQDRTYHSYQLKGKRIIKATTWFEMTSDYDGPLTAQEKEGITEVGWFSKRQVKENLKNSYPLIRWLLKETGWVE